MAYRRRWTPKKGPNGGIIATRRYPCIVCEESFIPNVSEIFKVKVGHKNRYRHHECAYVPKTYARDPNFKPTDYQEAIFNWVHTKDGSRLPEHLVVVAYAGTGKTKTAEQACFEIRDLFQQSHGCLPSIRIVAFNRPIAQELEKILDPSYCFASTFHSWGLELCRQLNPKCKINDGKLWEICELHLPNWREERARETKKKHRKLFFEYMNLISKMKATMAPVDECVARFGIDIDPEDFHYAELILDACRRDTNRVDFDDMIWLPVEHGVVDSRSYDFFMVDEVQDLNPVMIELVKLQMAGDTRFVGLGDRYQAIYAFRGAGFSMVDDIVEELGATELPLPKTWRNPLSHTRLVQDLEHVPGFDTYRQDEGELYYHHQENMETWLTEKHTVISRTNAPLISLAFKLIALGKKATIKGKEFGQNLIKFIDDLAASSNAYSIPTLRTALEEYYEKEQARLERTGNRRTQVILERLMDKIDCIRALCDSDLSRERQHAKTEIAALKMKLESIFDENVKGVGLYSIHKVKGMTVGHSVLINYDKLPFTFPEMSDEDFQQEKNMQYVALTRSNQAMTLCYSKPELVPPEGGAPPETQGQKKCSRCKVWAVDDKNLCARCTAEAGRMNIMAEPWFQDLDPQTQKAVFLEIMG